MYQGRRRKPNRLRGFDYSQYGWYFVTIYVKNREGLFGRVENGQMTLNQLGINTRQCWLEIPKHYPNVRVDEFVIMPNHLHGMIMITGDQSVGAIHELPLQLNRRRMLLPKIIGYFKMNSAKQINQIRQTLSNPVWQRNYYDHIIRNEKSFLAIREYIRNNPANWATDEENPLRRQRSDAFAKDRH